MKILKWVLIVLAVAFVCIQAVRPARTNPEFDQSKTLESTAVVTPETAAILERSCNDCHSSRTRWPWYSNIAPVSWYLVSDVNKGRRNLNLSEWGTYNAKKADRKLQEICEQVEHGQMPLKAYVLIHSSAKLSDADKQTLCGWTKQEQQRLQASGAK